MEWFTEQPEPQKHNSESASTAKVLLLMPKRLRMCEYTNKHCPEFKKHMIRTDLNDRRSGMNTTKRQKMIDDGFEKPQEFLPPHLEPSSFLSSSFSSSFSSSSSSSFIIDDTARVFIVPGCPWNLVNLIGSDLRKTGFFQSKKIGIFQKNRVF